MKKLSLDDLKVESYASQISEAELAEVKGGTAWQCAFDVASLIIAAYAAYKSGSDSSTGGSEPSTGGTAEGSGGTIVAYGFSADSVHITEPDSSITKLYRVEGDSLVLMYQ